MIAPIAVALLHRNWPVAIAMFGIAALSDGADGFLAKRFGWQSNIGALLDPAADKLLVACVFVVLAVGGSVPLWLMAAALGRDLVIVCGALAYRLRFGPLKVRPSLVSKINTLCQMLFLLCVVVRREIDLPPAWVETSLGALTFATISTSGLDYVITYGCRAKT
ncbi:MAG: CDP-alcohol phosphatidyltransferase family protein [Steroidobacteraceae bacterium]|nr:CDP-alcohol phosphatidyltransferase family protein [Steroidobacteraceae bacterium]